MLKNNGYLVKILNTVDFKRSMKYNPFAYIRETKDIAKVVDALIEGTTTGKQQGEQLAYVFGISVKNKADKTNQSIRDAAYDSVLGKIKEASLDGEVTYFSYEDIDLMVDELKKE